VVDKKKSPIVKKPAGNYRGDSPQGGGENPPQKGRGSQSLTGYLRGDGFQEGGERYATVFFLTRGVARGELAWEKRFPSGGRMVLARPESYSLPRSWGGKGGPRRGEPFEWRRKGEKGDASGREKGNIQLRWGGPGALCVCPGRKAEQKKN